MKTKDETNTCFYCDAFISNPVEMDHFPIPKCVGGKETVPVCRSCHDMKDKYPLGQWPLEWVGAVLMDFPKLSRETKLFLGKAAATLAQAQDLLEHRKVRKSKDVAREARDAQRQSGGH